MDSLESLAEIQLKTEVYGLVLRKFNFATLL
jgi:hypothetical protein